MTETGQIGAPESQLGNIIPALGAQQVTGPVEGQIELVGETYDVAIGYLDPSTNITKMVGYVLTPGTEFKESTNLQDEEHLVQIASPLSTDRYGRFPKVSQGDWSHGEGQLIYVDPTKFYYASGIDPTKAGELQLLPSPTVITLLTSGAAIPNDTGVFLQSALASDGKNWILGLLQASTNILQYVAATSTLSLAQVGTPNSEVTGAIGAGGYIFVCTQGGIWRWATAGTGVQQTSDVPWQQANPNLAYFDGKVYYALASGAHNDLHSIAVDSGAVSGGAAVATLPTSGPAGIPQGAISCLASMPNGVFIAQGGYDYNGTATGISYLYTFDGSTATKIAELQGYVKCAFEMNGVVYLIAEQAQAQYSATPGGVNGITPNLHQFTLYSLSGSALSLIQDFRIASSDFQNGATLEHLARASLAGDGLNLYIGFPGYDRIIGYTPSTGAFFNAGQVGVLTGSIRALRCVPLAPGGLLAVERSSTGQSITAFSGTPMTSGLLYSSFIDFDTPAVDKAFKSVEFSMNSALDTSAVSVRFRLDNQANVFRDLLTQVSPSGNALICYFPTGTIGHRIQLQITLSGTSKPNIASYSVLATLARTWDFTVACRRNQQARNPSGQPDPQALTAQQLYANIVNAYRLAAGQVTLWMPDPTVPNTAEPGGVSQVRAQIQDYQRTSRAEAGAGIRTDSTGSRDFDCDIRLVVSEVAG